MQGRLHSSMFRSGAGSAPAGGWRTILAAAGARRVGSAAVGQAALPVSCALLLALVLMLPLPNRARPHALRIPFRTVQSMIVVDGKVNGNPAVFLLDTGANRTIISGKVYGDAQVHLEQMRLGRQGAGAYGISTPLRADLVIADHVWAEQRVSVMDLDELNELLKLHFDGLLGQDILRQFRSIRIDYQTKTIELEE